MLSTLKLKPLKPPKKNRNKVTENYLMKFDKQGSLKFKIEWLEVKKSEYIYNSKKQLIQITSLDKDGEMSWKDMKYDSEGNKCEEISYNVSRIIRYSIELDSKGNEIEENRFDEEVKLISRYTYNHDSKGNIIEKYYYDQYVDGLNTYPDEDSGLVLSTTYEYDSKGKLIEKIDFDEDELEYRYTFKYDSEGKEIVRNYFSNEYGYTQLVSQHIYIYNSKGKLIEQNDCDENTKLEYRYTYKYDTKEDLIEKATYNEYGVLVKKIFYIHEYDNKGNWTKRVCYDDNNKLVEIKKRNIVYYGDDDENSHPEYEDSINSWPKL